MRRDPPWPVRPARQARGRRRDRERLWIEPLRPTLDRIGVQAADRDVVAQRVELARLAAHQRVGRKGVVDGGDLEPLARPDAEAHLPSRAAPSPRPAVLARPGAGPVRAGHGSEAADAKHGDHVVGAVGPITLQAGLA
jgi:hypothetical protein